MQDPRQLAFLALQSIYQHDAYTDIALHRQLSQGQFTVRSDRALATELVYGTVRRQRTLDALLDHLGSKKAHQQPATLRIVLHLGLYQLRYLSHIPAAAAVNTSVELSKINGLPKLAGVVNGILRRYQRLSATGADPLPLSRDHISRLGIEHSFPDWLVQYWLESLGLEQTEQLCSWFNQPAAIDLRINPLQSSIEDVSAAMQAVGGSVVRLPHLPQGLRLTQSVGAINQLPGFEQGWWTVQDASAQLVSHFLDPQPGEVIVDACAAPGGKATHIAELMQDQGTVWACDRSAKRLRKVTQNAQRLQLRSLQLCTGDSRQLTQFREQADRVLLDVPCSGLGTLHRRPDLRWRQTLENIQELSQLQQELLIQGSQWVKPSGYLVYATCTLHPVENEHVIEAFCNQFPQWQIVSSFAHEPCRDLCSAQGWIKLWPHQRNQDGFFMAKLKKQ